MHPAYSVIFFTTATGAGYGLLAALGLIAGFGVAPADFWLGLVGLVLALGLISTGLLSSTGHLGRPERAWRAFSQWRSSWLSREGVAAVATFLPAVLLGLGWVVLGRTDGWVALSGIAVALCAALTVCCTAMIYASLKPIAQWHSPFTLPGYLVYAAASGTTLLAAVLAATGQPAPIANLAALVLTLLAGAWKIATWRHDDRLAMPATINSATGLAGGTVRSIEWPHTEENYLLKEMGYRVARKHRDRLRALVLFAAFALPTLLLLPGLAAEAGIIGAACAVLAALCQFLGLLVERWLFFAEAKHTVTLYYGRA
ncbi:DmsC/YnfH family molybdoenzyme membrane anchor subunit [Bosea sp. 117]|uniref:dimethyl sulfoxide reductase anchor subunit family protein n=1 Tax=Bosea sp. 117 TaxID=1125973 RepID=UPI000493F298|nr:DmsC/YnfH family molybdoenzyme membrane anchor subunit [Bosea sp. 117]